MKMSKNSFIFLVMLVVFVLGIFIYLRSQKTSPSESNNVIVSEHNTDAILACYQNDASGASKSIPNNSIQNVKETSRLLINMPKDLYPQDLQGSWTTVAGNATAGSIGGGFGEAEGALPGCWSSHVDFEGNGEVDLRVKSIVEGTPDYFVRFVVSQ